MGTLRSSLIVFVVAVEHSDDRLGAIGRVAGGQVGGVAGERRAITIIVPTHPATLPTRASG